MAIEVTGVSLAKLVKVSVHWDKSDFDGEPEWQRFLEEIKDPQKAQNWFDAGESDCGSDEAIDDPDNKVYIELEHEDNGSIVKYQLLNPDKPDEPGPIQLNLNYTQG